LPIRPRVRSLSRVWIERTSARRKSSSNASRLRARLGGGLRAQVRAPGDHVHLERPRHARDPAAEPPEPDEPERAARELGPDRALPAALAHAAVLLDEVALQRDDQAPRELGGRARQPAGAADGDAELPRRVHVDRGVAHAGRHEQLQIGERCEPLGRERRPLAHRDDHLEVREHVAHDAVAEQVVVEVRDLGRGLQRLPRPEAVGDALVVVEHRDLDGHGQGMYAVREQLWPRDPSWW